MKVECWAPSVYYKVERYTKYIDPDPVKLRKGSAILWQDERKKVPCPPFTNMHAKRELSRITALEASRRAISRSWEPVIVEVSASASSADNRGNSLIRGRSRALLIHIAINTISSEATTDRYLIQSREEASDMHVAHKMNGESIPTLYCIAYTATLSHESSNGVLIEFSRSQRTIREMTTRKQSSSKSVGMDPVSW
jgi:hypothetical protein